MSRERWASGLLAGACLWLSAGSAEALPPRRVSLQYTRAVNAQGCIDPVALARKVEAYTGPVLVAPAGADVAVEVHVERKPRGGFRARMQVTRGAASVGGERVLEDDARDCRSFDGALAFVIATTIDPDLELERVASLFGDEGAVAPEQALLAELEASPPTPRAPEPAAVKPPAPVPLPAPAPRLPGDLGLGVALSSALPAAALGPALRLRWPLRPWLALGAGAQLLFASRPEPVSTGELRTRQFSASLLACGRGPWQSRVSASLCAGPQLSLLHAQGSGFDHDQSGRRWSVGATVRPELGIVLGRAYGLAFAPYVSLQTRQTLSYEAAGAQREVFGGRIVVLGVEIAIVRSF